MTRIITLAALSLTLGACDELVGNDDSGIGFAPTGPVDGISVDAGTVDCLDETQVELTMSTSGPVAQAEIYSQETGNIEPQWGENTNLTSVGNGEWEQTLITRRVPGNDLTPSDIVQDQNSLFRCDREGTEGFHHNAGVMTYIFRAYDTNDSLGDCVVAGDDPDGLIRAGYQVVNGRGPANPQDVNSTDCRVEAFTY